jgi:hypothetical protein
MKVLWLAAGAAVGYVFGTKAGREQYDKLKAAALEWVDKPAVTDAVARVGELADKGKDAVAAKLAAVTDNDTTVIAPQVKAVRTTPTTATS